MTIHDLDWEPREAQRSITPTRHPEDASHSAANSPEVDAPTTKASHLEEISSSQDAGLSGWSFKRGSFMVLGALPSVLGASNPKRCPLPPGVRTPGSSGHNTHYTGTDYHPEGALACTVNPAVGREKEFEAGLKPAATKKKVLVIGGGPGGMEAAIVAAERGHSVTLWERDDKLGGTLNLAIMPPGKDDLKSAIEYPARKLGELKVTVNLGKEATTEAVSEFSPDAVVVAAGSNPLIPRIKGMDRRKVVTFRDVMSGKVEVGNRVIVVGGGFVGCELSDLLAKKGKKVTVIEILPQLASELFPPIADIVIQEMLKTGRVEVFTEVKEEEITDKGMEIVDKDGNRVSLEADDIVIAAGSVADKTLYQSLKGKVPELYEVGDCAKARRILEAVTEGATAGLTI